MKKVTAAEMRSVEGGASKYVYCPVCGYKYKTGLLERLFKSNSTVKGYLTATHGYLKNINRGWEYAGSQAVHN